MNIFYRFLAFCCLVYTLQSCEGGKGFAGFGRAFTDLDSFSFFAQNMDADSSIDDLYQTYKLNEFMPFWLDESGPKGYTAQLISEIQKLQKEGIFLDSSLLTELHRSIDILDSSKSLNAAEAFRADSLLVTVYHLASKQLLFGSKPSPKAEQWFVENDSFYFGTAYLASWKSDSFPVFDTFRSLIPDYSALLQEVYFWEEALQDSTYVKAKNNPDDPESLALIIQKETKSSRIDSLQTEGPDIKKYQEFFGINPSGKIDATTKEILNRTPEQYIRMLQTNLDRLRRLPRDIGPHFVWVNIPAMELAYIRDGASTFAARVIVGTTVRPTPSISSPMTQIVFNPPWGVPPTILKNDVAPGVSRSGSAYLRRKGLRAYDRRGRDVTDQVNGSNIRKYHISQPPGAGNALGDIKFNMPNDEAIYIHDTPNRGQFSQRNRALSSGCVRTENPRILAEKILDTDSFRQENIAKIINTRRTRIHDLQTPIPVYIIYLTASLDQKTNNVKYLRDIYKRDRDKPKS